MVTPNINNPSLTPGQGVPAPEPGAGQLAAAPPPAETPPEVLQLQQQAARAGQLQGQLAAQQAEMARVHARAQAQETRNLEAEANNWAMQQAQIAVPQMVAQGWQQDQAEIAARSHYQSQAEKGLRIFTERVQVEQQRQYAVQELSRVSGMPPAMLQGLPDFDSMVSAARQYMATVGPQRNQLYQLQQQVAALTRGQVPPQNYARPGAPGAAGTGYYAQRLASGGPMPSPAEIDRMTAQYLRG